MAVLSLLRSKLHSFKTIIGRATYIEMTIPGAAWDAPGVSDADPARAIGGSASHVIQDFRFSGKHILSRTMRLHSITTQ